MRKLIIDVAAAVREARALGDLRPGRVLALLDGTSWEPEYPR